MRGLLSTLKTYDLLARISMRASCGDGYYWVWSKYEIRRYQGRIPSQLIFSEALVYTTYQENFAQNLCSIV